MFFVRCLFLCHKKFVGVHYAALCCRPDGVETWGEAGEVEGGRRRERLEVQNVAAGDVVEVNRGERLARHNLHPVAGGVGAEGETALGVGSLEDAINSLEESHEDSVLRDGEGARVAGVVVTPFVENIRAVQRGCGDGDLRVGEIVALALHGAPVGHAGVEFDEVAPVLGEEGGDYAEDGR